MGIPEFNKQLDITTEDNKTTSFIKQEILILDSSSFDDFTSFDDFASFYGLAIIIKEGNDILLIKEIYSLEKNDKNCILRFSYDKYENAKVVGNTIEKKEDGSEVPITVIESYDNIQPYIGSISNIISIKTDKTNENKKSEQNLKILKLIREKFTKTNEKEEYDLAA